VKQVLDNLVEKQTHTPDAVYLAVPPEVETLPEWLEQYDKHSNCLKASQTLSIWS